MNFIDQYNIPINRIGNGSYNYDFNVSKKFFEHFTISDIDNGKIKVIVTLEKQHQIFILNFNCEGFVSVLCDRCLDEFNLELSIKNKLLVKFEGNHYENQSDNMIIIPVSEENINIAQYIYELILLEIPIKRTHLDDSFCNREMINKLEEHKMNKSENIDPRWDKLSQVSQENK